MQTKSNATYDLSTIKSLLSNPGTCHITSTALWNAVSLGYAGRPDIIKRVLQLTESEFHKTMESEDIPGLWQDVYYTYDENVKLYIKLQLSKSRCGVIIQFKKS